MTWAHYLLQVNIYLVIFYAFYKLLLDKETYFMLNRIYLLSAGLLSLVIPFMKPEWFLGPSANHHMKINIDQLNMIMANVTVSASRQEQFNWGLLITGIYLAGALFFAVRLIFRLFAVSRLIKTKHNGAAFSFFRKKIVDDTLPELDTINTHEDIHIRQYHTLDILFFELLAILTWCNPAVYLYKTTVKNIHEYLADEEAARFQGDKESYAMLLLSKAFGIDQNVLTNSFFNQSLIKKRIFMLNKQRSRKTAILKYGLFLPLFAAMLLLSSATISRNEEIKAVAEQIASPVSLSTDLKSENDWDAFYKYVSKTIKYPAIARDNELQGNTMIKFSVIQGEISGISTVYTLGLGCDAQAMKAILGYTNFMHVQDGNYTIKIAFRLPDASSKISNPEITSPKGYTALPEITVVANNSPAPAVAKTEETTYDYVLPATNPEFPGGMTAFYKYLSEACRYPAEARENHVEGKVLLSFIVEKDGRIADVKVEKGLGSGTDEEAVRIMENSPKWTPGYANGEPVRVQLNLPVNFSLDHLSSIAIRQAARSNNQPLYVIDGVVQSQPFTSNTLDPNTIESINVIKDGAANTIYGDAGKNGVILITLKKGKSRSVPPPPPASNVIKVQIP